MRRLTILVSPLFLVACAAPRQSALVASDPIDSGANTRTVALESLPSPTSTPTNSPAPVESARVEPTLATELAAGALGFAPEEESLYNSRFTVKGGLYSADEDAIDDGYIFNVSWMTYFSRLFALEFELGYFDAEGSDGPIDAEVWSVPIMVNGRLNVPIWVLEGYAGLGVGGFYYDAEATGGFEEDGFLLGGNGFLGASINLADAISLGLEAKYYLSEEIDNSDAALDAFALMLTLGFSR